jgi:hypothetical protein
VKNCLGDKEAKKWMRQKTKHETDQKRDGKVKKKRKKER